MLYLESFVHRVALAEVISRWMLNQPRPGDLRILKRVVNFNSHIARLWVDDLTREILRSFHGREPTRHVIQTKGQLKDFVVDHPTYMNPRIEEMRARYRRFPEDFYRETPVDASYYVMAAGAQPTLVGAARIKHFRRIAEKGARRIVDFMLKRIRQNADNLAEERARSLGIAKSQLYTPQAEMVAEYSHAERRVIKSIKRGTILPDLPVLAIPDVCGIKVIVEDQDYGRLMEKIRAMPQCKILEEEKHSGLYNAVNLRLAYTLPRALLEANPPAGHYLRVLEFRGFDRATIADEYRQFLATAEDHVLVEVIVSNFQEYLESEVGRCMHEERVLSQRSHLDFMGNLATNIRYLMDYMLGLCRGAGMPEITDVPVKLWVKYMPDTIEYINRSLYVPDDLFLDSVPDPVPGAPAAATPPVAASAG